MKRLMNEKKTLCEKPIRVSEILQILTNLNNYFTNSFGMTSKAL